MIELGALQVAKGWAAVTGRGRVNDDERAMTVIVEQADPLDEKTSTTITILGEDGFQLNRIVPKNTFEGVAALSRASPMLVNCVAYEHGEKVADLPLEDVRGYLKGPGSFVWVALKDPDERELQLVEEKFSLHELAVEDARHGHQRPKLEEYGSSLFVVLHVVERGGDELTQGEVAIFVGPWLHRLGQAQHRARLRRRAPPLRAGAGAVAPWARLRPLRADGRHRGSLRPGPGGPRRGRGATSRSGSSAARTRAPRSKRSTVSVASWCCSTGPPARCSR